MKEGPEEVDFAAENDSKTCLDYLVKVYKRSAVARLLFPHQTQLEPRITATKPPPRSTLALLKS